jgi:hypothetical protein
MEAKFIIIFIGLVIIGYCLKNKKESFMFTTSYYDPLIDKIKNDLLPIDPRIAGLTFKASNASETINKKNVYLCIKDKNGKYYDYNMLIYVALHECAHAISKAIDEDHNNTSQEFMDNFSMLLDKASALGIYNPALPKTKNYCPT